MNTVTALTWLFIALTWVTLFITYKRVNRVQRAISVPRKQLALSYNEAISILNAVIEECLAERMFTLRFNEKPTIPPLDDELVYMTKKILGSLSPELTSNIQLYLSNEFITRYISRNIRDVCMQYIEEVRSK